MQEGPGTHILYQDVPLGEGSHELSLIAYYESEASIASPESLSPEGGPNQQYRIDVLKEGAPLGTLNPEGIIATLLHTEEAAHRPLRRPLHPVPQSLLHRPPLRRLPPTASGSGS